MKNFRPTAVPLMVNDPSFSVWSFADHLYDDTTRHWTGSRHSLCGVLSIDGEPFRFLGTCTVSDAYIGGDCKTLKQTSLTVDPTTTVYTFTHPVCDLTVTFVTPLLMDRLEVLTRPVSYMFYEITVKEEGHDLEVYFDAANSLAGDPAGQSFRAYETEGHAWLGNAEQNVLGVDGDDVRIDWGYLHLVHPNAHVAPKHRRHNFINPRISPRHFEMDLEQEIPFSKYPLLCATSKKLSDVFVLAYDDLKSIKYYDRHIDAYYKKFYGDFETMLALAVKEADELRATCAAFD